MCAVLDTPDFEIHIKVAPQGFQAAFFFLFPQRENSTSHLSMSPHATSLQSLLTCREHIRQTRLKESLIFAHMEAISLHVASIKPASASFKALYVYAWRSAGFKLFKLFHRTNTQLPCVNMKPNDFEVSRKQKSLES